MTCDLTELLLSLFIDGTEYAQTFAQPQLNLTELRREEQAMTYFLAGPVLADIMGLI